MKKLVFAMFLVVFNSFADEIDLEIKQIEQQIRWNYPKLTFVAIERSQMPHIYEIWTGKDVFFTDGRYILVGTLFSPEGNLKDKRIAYYQNKYGSETERKLNNLDFKKGLKIGNGKQIVVEFSDPECPYCRRGEKFFKDADVTRYVFFMPLSFHKKAKPLAIHILCSSNPEEEYKKAISGELDSLKNIKSCKEGEEKLNEMIKIANDFEISGTPIFYIKTKKGWKKSIGANKNLLKLLSKKGE